jgi:hypothetical protein
MDFTVVLYSATKWATVGSVPMLMLIGSAVHEKVMFISGIRTNESIVMGPEGAPNQGRLCWWSPAANYCTALSTDSFKYLTRLLWNGIGPSQECRRCYCYIIIIIIIIIIITPRGQALQRTTLTQPLDRLPALYGTRSFNVVLTRVRNWFLSSSTWIQSIPCHPISPRSILILF